MSARRLRTFAALCAASIGCAGEAGPDVTVETHLEQPMVVDITVVFESPVRLTARHADDPGVHVEIEDDDAATTHRLRVRGLAPGRAHAIELEPDGAPPERVEFTTPPALVGFVPTYDTFVSDTPPSPGYRLVSAVGAYSVGYNQALLVDTDGVTRWYLPGSSPQTTPLSVHSGLALREDGTLLYATQNRVAIIDELGEERFGVDAAELGYAVLHHDVAELPGGTLLAIATEFRDIIYPNGELRRVAGDALVEFRPERDESGAVAPLWTWSAFDHLDTQRITDGFWEQVPDPTQGTLAHDWTHANAVVYDPRDDSLLVSLRHQDWILKLDRASGEVLWRLGLGGDFLLEDGAWFFHQHAPQWQQDGDLQLYDNGVFNPYLDDALERSRVVRYALDTVTWTARVTWEDPLPQRVSVIGGDADTLATDEGERVLVLDSFLSEGLDAEGLPLIRAWLHELDPTRPSAAPWSLSFPSNLFVYRASATDRLPGERRSSDTDSSG